MHADAGEALRLLVLGKISIDRLFQSGIRTAVRCARRRVLVPALAMRRAGTCRDSREDQNTGQRDRPRSDRSETRRTGLDCHRRLLCFLAAAEARSELPRWRGKLTVRFPAVATKSELEETKNESFCD